MPQTLQTNVPIIHKLKLAFNWWRKGIPQAPPLMPQWVWVGTYTINCDKCRTAQGLVGRDSQQFINAHYACDRLPYVQYRKDHPELTYLDCLGR